MIKRPCIKRIGLFMICLSLALSSTTGIHATTMSEIKKQKQEVEKEKQQAESNLEAVESDIEAISEEKAAMEEEVEVLDELLLDLLIEVELLKADIEDKKAAIEQAKIDYEAALEREKKQQEAMALRIKFMYEKGNESYLEILLESKNMGEAVNRVEYTEKLYAYDRMLLEQYQLAKEEVAKTEEAYENELSELEEIEEDYEIQQAELNALIEEKQKTISNFSRQLSDAKAKANEYQQQIKAQSDKLKKINQEEQAKIAEEARKKAEAEAKKKAEEAAKKKAEEEAKKKAEAEAKKKKEESEKSDDSKSDDSSSDDSKSDDDSEIIVINDSNDDSNGTQDDSSDDDVTTDDDGSVADEPEKEPSVVVPGSGTGASIANYALQFVGNPYVPGGTSLTNGCDCSGFTQGVYSHFGISIPRSSYSQSEGGKAVDYANIQPGDIIYYGGHVGIYIGNNQIVHASTPATGIKISSAFYRSIVSIRRYY